MGNYRIDRFILAVLIVTRNDDVSKSTQSQPGSARHTKKSWDIGLSDGYVAVKTQRMKHTILWLRQRPDRYFTAWRQLACRRLAHAAKQTRSFNDGKKLAISSHDSNSRAGVKADAGTMDRPNTILG